MPDTASLWTRWNKWTVLTVVIVTGILLGRRWITVDDMASLYRETQRRGTVDEARQMFEYVVDTRP